MDKKELRHIMRGLPSDLPGSGDALAKVETISEFIDSDIVLLYSSIPGEIETASFIEKWYGAKRIALPKVTPDGLELREYDPAKVEVGYRGIIEPGADAALIHPYKIDFALIPGLAFDPEGRRLGRGKGYYDRLLPLMGCLKAGITFDERVVERVPVEEHDMSMDMVITPNNLYICRK